MTRNTLIRRILALVAACATWPALADDPARSMPGTVRSSDGLTIHYTVRGSGSPALVFVHGWSCDSSYWKAQADRFARTYTVVTVDLAGHGASEAGRERWTMAAFGEDVRAVVEKLDVDPVVLIGHSMGGAVMVEAALAMPDRVCGLVAVDTFHTPSMGLAPEQIDAFVAQLEAALAPATEAWVRTMFPEGADPELVDRVARDMAAAPPDVATAVLRESLTWYSDQAPRRLAGLRCPLHAINADRIPTQREALSELVEGYELRLMPGHGHFLALEDPATFNELLSESLASFEGCALAIDNDARHVLVHQ